MPSLFAAREADRYRMHTQHLNEQMVRVLKTIGYDVGFCRGKGQYLFDREPSLRMMRTWEGDYPCPPPAADPASAAQRQAQCAAEHRQRREGDHAGQAARSVLSAAAR